MDSSAKAHPAASSPWGQAHALLAFAENMDAQSFSVLSPGLGLGELRPVTSEARKMPPSAAFVETRTSRPEPPPRVNKENKASRTRLPPPSQPPKERARPQAANGGFERRLMAWAVDFLFVTSSLALALAIATFVAHMRVGDSAGLLELRPVIWLAGFGPLHILLGVYGVFVVYCVLFRFLVGRTFGQSVMGVSARTLRTLRST